MKIWRKCIFIMIIFSFVILAFGCGNNTNQTVADTEQTSTPPKDTVDVKDTESIPPAESPVDQVTKPAGTENTPSLEEWIGTYSQMNWEGDAAMNQEKAAKVIIFNSEEDGIYGTFFDGIDTYTYLFTQLSLDEKGTTLTMAESEEKGAITLTLTKKKLGFTLGGHVEDCYNGPYSFGETSDQVLTMLTEPE